MGDVHMHQCASETSDACQGAHECTDAGCSVIVTHRGLRWGYASDCAECSKPQPTTEDRLRALLRRCYDAGPVLHEGRSRYIDRDTFEYVPCSRGCLACAIERELGEVERG